MYSLDWITDQILNQRVLRKLSGFLHVSFSTVGSTVDTTRQGSKLNLSRLRNRYLRREESINP